MKFFLTAWAVLILCVSARAADCSLTLFATDSGWYTSANYHDPDNNNYLVGYHAAGATEFRDWFVFDLPPSLGPIQSVELRLFAFTINSTNAETFELYHVATPVSTLVAGAGPTISRVFTDLGEGALYGSRVVSVSEANNYITIPLNSNAVAAIAAAGGQRFALGGKLSSISPTPVSDESLFSFSSGMAPNVQLNVSFAGTGVPAFFQQPPPLVLLSSGSTTNISVIACGSGTLRYQWFFNSLALPNQTNSTLIVANAGAGQAGNYYVVVTNVSGAITSTIARLYIDAAAPFISSGPFDLTVTIGNAANFYAVPLGNPVPQLRWQFNGVDIPGATNEYLFIPNVQASDAGTYTAVASNIFGVASNSAVLFVEPLIAYPLTDYTVASGQDFHYPFYVGSSVPVSYQWRFNGVNIPGANGAYLSLFNVSSNEAGAYDVVVANSYGMRTSAVGRLTVQSQAPKAIGADAITSELLGSDALVYGDVGGSAPISVQWYFNNAPVNGATNLQLLLRDLSLADAGKYSFIASNAFGVSTGGPVFLTVSVQPPVITGSGFNTEAFVRDAARITANVSGGPRPTLQWQFEGVDIPDATNTSLLLTNLSVAQGGVYALVAANQFGTNIFTTSLNVKPRRALDRWTWRNSRPQANDLRQITYGNGRLLAGGEAGSLVTSTNGIDWSVVSLGRPYLISHVAFGNGLFAALAEGNSTVLFTSPDGADWTAYDIPFAYARSLDFVNGEFLMAGYSGGSSYAPILLAHSANGSAWQITPMLGTLMVPSAIKYGNGTYVAGSYYEISTSKDGVHWVKHSVPGDFTRLTFENGLFVASSGAIWTSSDGDHWSIRNPGIRDVNGVAYGNGFFVAVGDDGEIVRSPNANIWARVDSTTSQNLRDVVFDGTKFIACGNSGVLLTSPNSVTWTDRRAGKTKDLYGIIYANDQFVVVGYEGTILTSPDGSTWTTRTSPNSRDLHAVTYGGGQYVAVGRRGAVLTSPDAINWTSRATPTTNYLQRIAWGNGRFVVTGEDATILSSTNAINWQQHTANVPANTQMEGVAYGTNVFVIVGGYFAGNANSIMLVSSNGITWSNVSYNLGVIARGVTFGFNRFLAVGNDGAVIFSPDGLAWSSPSSVAPYRNLRHIEVAAGRAVAVGNDGTIVSYNLDIWQNHASVVSDNLHDVAYGAGKFVAVGNAGAIVQSDDAVPVFSPPSFSNGAMHVNLRGGMEPEYDLQSSQNFILWVREGTFTNNGSAANFTISTNGYSRRFFRMRAP